MSKVYVFSTLAASQAYSINDGADTVEIAGGAGIASRNLVTPKGVMTAITAEEYLELKKNRIFELHETNGFITVSEKPADAETVAEDMNPNDPSKPDTPERAEQAAKEAQQVSGADQAPKATTGAKKK